MNSVLTPAHLRRRLVFSVSCALAVLVLAQLVVQPELARQQEQVGAANELGRQRLLALRLIGAAEHCDGNNRTACTARVAEGKQALVDRHPSAAAGAQRSLLADRESLDRGLADLISATERFDSSTSPERGHALHLAADEYVASVDSVMSRAASQVRDRLGRVRLMAAGFFAAFLGLLGFLAAFVVRPALRQQAQHIEELTRTRDELEASLSHVKRLQGLLPICMHCKGIRGADQTWHEIAEYLSEHTDAKLSHGICEPCLEKYYPEEADDDAKPSA